MAVRKGPLRPPARGQLAGWPAYRPQLPTLAAQAPSGPEWIHELKYDGRRVGCAIVDGEVRLECDDQVDCSHWFPEIVQAARGLRVERALLDGEVAIVGSDGRTSRDALEQALSGGSRAGLTYFVFDALAIDDVVLSARPLVERKLACARVLERAAAAPTLRYSEHFEIGGPELLERACELGASGLISKRRDAPYEAGKSRSWRETRCTGRALHTSATSAPAREAKASSVQVRGVSISSPNRVVYGHMGFSKLELAEFYSQIADWILPHVRNRPLTLVRCDKGVHDAAAFRRECRFLRHEPGWHRWVKAPIRRVRIQEQKKVGEYLVIDSAEALVALVQGDITELHVWNSTVDRLETPDQLVFDLDPGEDVPWAEVIDAARLMRAQLGNLGLQSWPKLTGGKGIHVVVPIEPERGWAEVYGFAQSTVQAVAQREPSRFTLDYGRAGRAAKILLDYKRNHRAAVAIASYSARARPSGSVAAPVAWRDLDEGTAPDHWTVRNLPAELQRRRADPWREFWTVRQRLPA